MLDEALRAAVRVSFDRLDVDGSTSTNDTVLVLASGASGVEADPMAFTAALTAVCRDLAQQMQADAEGVTKRITVRVSGAASEDDAVTVARTVARDSLVKTALFGSDPNWGRVAAAVGYSDADVDPETARHHHQRRRCSATAACAAGDRAAADLSGKEVLVQVELRAGQRRRARSCTTDLSHAYVEENSAYSS